MANTPFDAALCCRSSNEPLSDNRLGRFSAAGSEGKRANCMQSSGNRHGAVVTTSTTGRKSGRPRTIPLLYLPDGKNLVVVASNGGTAGDPAWRLNFEDDLEANVEVGGRKLRVRAEEAEGKRGVGCGGGSCGCTGPTSSTRRGRIVGSPSYSCGLSSRYRPTNLVERKQGWQTRPALPRPPPREGQRRHGARRRGHPGLAGV